MATGELIPQLSRAPAARLAFAALKLLNCRWHTYDDYKVLTVLRLAERMLALRILALPAAPRESSMTFDCDDFCHKYKIARERLSFLRHVVRNSSTHWEFVMSAFAVQGHTPLHRPRVLNVSRKCPVNCRKALPNPAVIFVTPRGFCRDAERAINLTGEALDGGACLVQIRDIDASDEERTEMAHRLAKEFSDPSLFLMNGPLSLKIAQEIPGFGIHLREKDRPYLLSAALSLTSENTYVGCSVHSVRSAIDAVRHGAISYLQVGTMFETASHPGKRPEGVRLLTDIRNALKDEHVMIGVGGIDALNAGQVIQHGAKGVAVISAISAALDPKQATREIVQAAKEAYNKQ